MTESEFQALAERTLRAIEQAFEEAADAAGIDVEGMLSGNVLEIEFAGNGSKIIINGQSAMQEIWVAAKSGGFHYRFDGAQWTDTRHGGELFAALSEMASAQAGCALAISRD